MTPDRLPRCCRLPRPGQLVEEHDEPPGLLLLLLLRHALHGVRLLRLHPPRHRVDAVFHLPVLLGVGVRVAGVLVRGAGGPGPLAAPEQAPGGQQARRVAVARVLDEAAHWETDAAVRRESQGRERRRLIAVG